MTTEKRKRAMFNMSASEQEGTFFALVSTHRKRST